MAQFLKGRSLSQIHHKLPDLQGIHAAADKLARVVPPTPLLGVNHLGRRFWVKCESLQPMRAFKLRGAWHRLTELDELQRSRGVVAFSSGNHAQGVAWAARELGLAATIVMPADAPAAKLSATRGFGADVILYDRQTQSREAIAAELAETRGAVLVPSFDDPWIIEGQGSAGTEITAQLGGEAPDLIITPCGGGGLAAGLALGVPAARIVIVEPAGWDDMAQSLRTGQIVPVGDNPPPTACDALQTKRVSPLTFAILHARNAIGVAVTEAQTEAAMRFAYRELALVIEPGGAVALAAVLAGLVELTERTVVLLSGGNVDAAHFARVISQ